ncbi:MAG TPA: sulfite exporter TauE/SafE family protein [Bryobacteraceae bacterium]|nr:sulfite exporter TauE/SafE family protein [Bryobacteraceae bacterium]
MTRKLVFCLRGSAAPLLRWEVMTYLTLLAIGLVAGVAAGMFGIGGGLIIVPALLFLLKLKELEAIGTSLAALIPPVGLLGAVEYYRNGYINLRYAALLASGLFLGAYFGARIMISLPEVHIRRLYGGFLLVIAFRMLITGK